MFSKNRDGGRFRPRARRAPPKPLAWRWVIALRDGVRRLRRTALPRVGRRKTAKAEQTVRRTKRKPAWVVQRIIRLAAHLPGQSGHTIAALFNREHAARGMTVGKTFVYATLRHHQYEIDVTRRNLKRRPPNEVPRDLIYGLDLTFKTDDTGKCNAIAGIIEHHSRWIPKLAALPDKSIITLLRFLLDAIDLAMRAGGGKPKILRTDNEPLFASWRFRLPLWLLRIRHQRTELGCPWQNGRIERFFGTLKEKLNRWEVVCLDELNGALILFRFWYNEVRPHQNLGARTPVEVWRGVDVFRQRPRRQYWFEAWDGLLTGIYLRH